MREIKCEDIIKTVKKLCIEAACILPSDVFKALNDKKNEETYSLAKKTIDVLIDNANLAHDKMMPICQDTGMVFVYVTLGQEVHIDGDLKSAINEGVRQGYQEGYLRKSIVQDPLFDRINTKDNTPAIIYFDVVTGDEFKIVVAPKGFGSENMSQIKMLKPSDGVQGVKDFVLKVINDAGPNACHHQDERYANLEKELLTMINATGIGPAGYGGKTTALSLNIETHPTHIAGMPVAVSICCHVSRHKEANL